MAESTPIDTERATVESDIEAATVNSLKRPRGDVERVSDAEDAGPEEKRPSFKLNPPKLIHGQAKPAPKDDAQDMASKKNFIRPSILSASTTVTQPVVSAPSTNGSNPIPSISQAPMFGSGLLMPARVPATNPFLKTDEGDEKKEETKAAAPANASDIQAPKDKEDSKENSADSLVTSSSENPFLQTTTQSQPSTSNDEATTNDSGAGFVFGRKMEDRVLKNETDSLPETNQANFSTVKSEVNDFVFGKNLSDRVIVAATDSNSSAQTTTVESVLFQSQNASENALPNATDLEKSAAALYNASCKKVLMPEVEVKTGEEDEKNVLQIQCKLYQYDATPNSKNWVERGRGNLRLNDKRISTTDKFQSRLVMRTNGSFRLILNTKIWAGMVVEKANLKSVRISAQNEEGEIGVYLIQATNNDADHIHRAIEYRVLHLKQAQKLKDSDNGESPSACIASKTKTSEEHSQAQEVSHETDISLTKNVKQKQVGDSEHRDIAESEKSASSEHVPEDTTSVQETSSNGSNSDASREISTDNSKN